MKRYKGAITSVTNLADRLKWAREQKKMSQGELAAAAKVSQGTIGNLESGERKNPRSLLSIARALDLNPDWLLHGSGPVRPTDKPATLSGWPFERISPSQWAALTERQRGVIEDAAVKALREIADEVAERAHQATFKRPPRKQASGGAQ